MLTAKNRINIKNKLKFLSLLVALSGAIACSTGTEQTAATNASSLNAPPSRFDNPVIKYDTKDPTKEVGDIIYTADPAVMVLDDTVYLYTTHDEQYADGSDYRMYDYRLWTSKDMVSWENRGAVLKYADFDWARGDEKTGNAYAHHMIHRKDASDKSRYYFYVTVEGGQADGKFGFAIGVAVSDSPDGPFDDPRGMPMILLEDTAQYKDHSWRNIDPAVFIDDDGNAYLYWGNKQLWWVELEPDLIHLKGESYTLNALGKMQNRDTSKVSIHAVDTLPNFEEAPYVSKHNDLYYLTYAAGFPESIAYATSSSVTGPWEYQGIIMDPLPGTTTIHPAIFDFQGNTYLAYHSAQLPGGGSYRRSVCVDRVYFNEDGTIKPIVRTSGQ
ncbi:glycoside hydrolase family 43 protein [Bowmanella dokdonensis]|uniref:Glycoside hydrolase family 43 protein n=1 Tax=Bowmanella dokdonensis TaxID=751969 RepID=A0A939IQV9_9ALTE|nr:glycoside hydrolase family 43 protein [Bowmanella dokdonensis]MBN7824836.1 glycoside hydrolase family 43 protein [Bowmanella dokdonensis]